jgi:hypothetical protein
MSEDRVRYGAVSRGVSSIDVAHAADTLLHAGQRPTTEKVRARIGRGSPNTIGPLLDKWWSRLASRLDAGPAAFHRLPEAVAHVAEALWMQALEESRRRVLLEHREVNRVAALDRERLELRSHVLNLREGEMEARIRDRDRQVAVLEEHARVLNLALEKEQASGAFIARQLSSLESELAASRQLRSLAETSRRRVRAGRSKAPRKSAMKMARAGVIKKGTSRKRR